MCIQFIFVSFSVIKHLRSFKGKFLFGRSAKQLWNVTKGPSQTLFIFMQELIDKFEAKARSKQVKCFFFSSTLWVIMQEALH